MELEQGRRRVPGYPSMKIFPKTLWLKIPLRFLRTDIYMKIQLYKTFKSVPVYIYKVKVTQSCPTLCHPMDYTVHWILQARILEWVAIPFSRGSSQPRDQTQVSALQVDSLTAEPQGKPNGYIICTCVCLCIWASLVAQIVNNLSVMQNTWVQSLGWEDPLEKGKATCSSSLAWRIPWTEEPAGLQSMGSQKVGHDWATSVYMYA